MRLIRGLKPIAAILTLALLPWFAGCDEGILQPSRPRTRKPPDNSSDYIQRYAEKELGRRYSERPDTKVSVEEIQKEGNHWRVDALITEQGKTTRKSLLVDSRGNILQED